MFELAMNMEVAVGSEIFISLGVFLIGVSLGLNFFISAIECYFFNVICDSVGVYWGPDLAVVRCAGQGRSTEKNCLEIWT